MTEQRQRIAIACQGGGSHTAFTAGVLQRILQDDHHYIVALSGTSGGAICALLTWYALLLDDRQRGIELLEAFWRDNSAHSFSDRWFNRLMVKGIRLRGRIAMLDISPYAMPNVAHQKFRAMLQRHVDFSRIPSLFGPHSPHLYVGAVEVLSGTFRIFRDAEISADAILASAAIPTLFRAVPLDGGLYWDGLFSHNPPVRDLPDSKPDELWVVQINPRARAEEPRTVDAIEDRRNELAGNLSLEQELHFIEKFNELVEKKMLVGERYKPMTIRRIELRRDLDHASKLDRDPAFIRTMMAYGQAEADAFLKELELEGEADTRGVKSGG